MIKCGMILLLICIQQSCLRAQQQSEYNRQLDSMLQTFSISLPCSIGFLDSNLESTTYFFNGEGAKLPNEKSLFNLSASAELFVNMLLAYQVSTAVVTDKTYVEQLLPPGTHVNPNLTEMISLFHLAAHTSGFSQQFGYTFLSYLPSEKEQPEVIQDLKTRKVIGYNKYKHSIFNTQLLLKLLERAESASFAHLLTKHLTNSLGMANTYTEVPGWYKDEVFGAKDPMPQTVVYSTLKDMLLLLEAQLQIPKGRIGKAMEQSTRIVSKEEGFDIAIAWKKLHSPNENIFYHESKTCLMMFNTSKRTGFVVLADQIPEDIATGLKEYFVAESP